MPNRGPVKVVDTLQGTSYLAIQSALKTLQRHAPDVSHRTFTVVRDGASTVVVLSGAGTPLAARVAPDAELSEREVARLADARVKPTVLDSVAGSSLLAIRAGAEVFATRFPDPSPYRITLMSEGDSLVVAFTDGSAAPGGRGAPGTRPGFEVELAAHDLSVRRSSFIR